MEHLLYDRAYPESSKGIGEECNVCGMELKVLIYILLFICLIFLLWLLVGLSKFSINLIAFDF